MPLFICNSRFSRESRLLRQAASDAGWETLRLDGWELPDWVDCDEPEVTIFGTVPLALDIADKFERTLLGCGADWLPALPLALLRRIVTKATLSEAIRTGDGRFVKGAISKILPAKVYAHEELRQAAATLSPELAVFVAEPVRWLVEYRCFVANGIVEAISPYRRDGQTWQEPPDFRLSASVGESDINLGLMASDAEVTEALEFAAQILNSRDVRVPPAFVLDIGIIDGRGWAVVEANEGWASGIYDCDPAKVLAVLSKACIPAFPQTPVHEEWDFARHYRSACPHAPQNAIRSPGY